MVDDEKYNQMGKCQQHTAVSCGLSQVSVIFFENNKSLNDAVLPELVSTCGSKPHVATDGKPRFMQDLCERQEKYDG